MDKTFVLIFTIISLCWANDLVVETLNGKVKGTILDTPSGTQFFAWRHIPYATPPLGELRFKAPEAPKPWDGILDATNDSYSCIFVGSFEGDPQPTYGQNEDCLYVNVYSPVTPNASANLSFPVLFWIYGGGFYAGSSDFAFYDPTPFLEDDVIVVTFNYRLSVFGFLSTEDEVLPGNSALKDQLSALKWTRDNIEFFGGNPRDITIFGESAGAMSVGYHLISPLSKDLFTGAILESGSCLLNFEQRNPRGNAVVLASFINSSITENSTSDEIIEVLQAADAELLVNLTLANGLAFRVVIEQNSDSAFVSQPFYELLESGNFSQVPVIIGTNSEEEIWVALDEETGKQNAAPYDKNPKLLLPQFTLKDNASEEAIAEEIRAFYVGNGTFEDNLGAFVNWNSENVFVRPSIKHASLQSKYTPVYFYRFSYVGGRSGQHPLFDGCGRVAHAEELPYLFNISTKPLVSQADYLTRKRFVKLWTNFAKTKNPTPDDDSVDLLQNVKWTRFDETNLQYLDIDLDLSVKTKLKAEKTAFWNNLWQTYATRPYGTF